MWSFDDIAQHLFSLWERSWKVEACIPQPKKGWVPLFSTPQASLTTSKVCAWISLGVHLKQSLAIVHSPQLQCHYDFLVLKSIRFDTTYPYKFIKLVTRLYAFLRLRKFSKQYISLAGSIHRGTSSLLPPSAFPLVTLQESMMPKWHCVMHVWASTWVGHEAC